MNKLKVKSIIVSYDGRDEDSEIQLEYLMKVCKRLKESNQVWAVQGYLRTWKGKTPIHMVVPNWEDLQKIIFRYEHIKFVETETGRTYIHLTHHDGQHVIELRVLNDKGLNAYYNGRKTPISQIVSDNKYSNNARVSSMVREG
jgi:hypothetical protein